VPRALDTVDRWIAAHRTRVERRLYRLGTYLDAATEADKEDIMTERTDRHATIVIQRSFRAAPARVFAAWAKADERRCWDVPGKDWVIARLGRDPRPSGGGPGAPGPREGALTMSNPARHAVDEAQIAGSGRALLDLTP